MKRIIVLGMHRSGASALARMIALLGASTGDPAHLRDTGENTALRKVNDALLEAAGGAWDGPPAGDDWLDDASARGLIERGREVLAAEFGNEPIAVWKDPRNALTLPFWVELLDEEPVVVLVHRHPAEVAASMKLAYSTRPAHAYALWERYNAAALAAATGLRTIVIEYGQLMTFPSEATGFVYKALTKWGIELPYDPATTHVELSPSRRHHIAPDRDRIDTPVATPSQAAVFALLDAVAGAHTPLTLPQPVPEPSPVSQELLAMAASIRQLEAERRELRHNERLAKRAAKRSAAEETDTETGDAGDTAPEPEATGAGAGVTALPIVAAPEVAAVAAPEVVAAPEIGAVDPAPTGAASAVDRPASGVAAGGGGKREARRARRRARRTAAAATDAEVADPVGLPTLPTEPADPAGDTPGDPEAADPAGDTPGGPEPAEPVGVPTLPLAPDTTPAGDPRDTESADPVGHPNLPTDSDTHAGDAPAPALAGVSIIDLVLRAKQEAHHVEGPVADLTDGAPTYGDAGPGMPHLRPYGEPERT